MHKCTVTQVYNVELFLRVGTDEWGVEGYRARPPRCSEGRFWIILI